MLCASVGLAGLSWLPLAAHCTMTAGKHWSRRGGCSGVQTVLHGKRTPILPDTIFSLCNTKRHVQKPMCTKSCKHVITCILACFVVCARYQYAFSNVTAGVCVHVLWTFVWLPPTLSVRHSVSWTLGEGRIAIWPPTACLGKRVLKHVSSAQAPLPLCVLPIFSPVPGPNFENIHLNRT